MKKAGKKILAALLSVLMILEMAQLSLASAAEAIDRALNPAEQIELSVPSELKDAGNYFFFAQSAYYLNETSREKVYIPVQRTGDLSEEAEVTVKVVDLTSHWGENYTFEIYKEKTDAVMEYGDVSLVDLVQNTESIDEVEQGTEEQLGEIIYLNGGMDIVDVDENVVGRVTATPLDENGNPIEDEDAPSPSLSAEPVDPADVDYGDSATGELRAARNAFTGTVSDRQGMASLSALLYPDETAEDGEEENDAAVLAEECYPGKEFRLHFDAGEEAKFLVLTPKYSERNDGNSELFILLRDPSENTEIADEHLMTDVTIFDEDEPEPVIVSMKETEIEVVDGYAYITVVREGAINKMVGVNLSSWDGSAETGTDYGGVGADLWFPMGITERTVKLPAARSAERKDFYVTLNTLLTSPCTIVKPTVHVVIPAAEIDPEAELMADDVVLSDLINLKDRCKKTYGHETEYRSSNYGFYARTKNDQTKTNAGIDFYLLDGYAYDGFRLTYHTYRNWASAKVGVDIYNKQNQSLSDVDLGLPDGNSDTKTYDQYFGGAEESVWASIYTWNYENHYSLVRDCHVRLWIEGVQMILRKFNFTVEDPKPLPLAGGGVANLGFTVGDNLRRTFSRYMNEDFTLNQIASTDQVRLVGIEVKKADSDSWRRITLSGGTDSSSVTYTLTKDQIDSLGKDGYIRWTTTDTKTEGNITVRPVFDYVEVEIEVRDNPYGTLYADGISAEDYNANKPTLLWDFNAGYEMDKIMLGHAVGDLDWHHMADGYGDNRFGYYVFRAYGSAKDPRISVDTPVEDAADIAWVKVRARNRCEANAIELFACVGSNTNIRGKDCVHINLAQDEEWHTYIISIPAENIATANAYKGADLTMSTWSGNINWFRLDPMWKSGDGNMNVGDEVDIDYIAFFPTRQAAKAFRAGKELSDIGENGQLLPGVYQFHAGDVLNFRTEMTDAGVQRGLSPAGVSYQLFDHKNGVLLNDSDSENYINGSLGFELSTVGRNGTSRGYYYVFEPTFAETANAVTVLVEDEDLAYFNTASGIFDTEDKWLDGTTWHYRVAANVLTNELFSLYAFPADSADVPLWSLPGDSQQYSGTCFYLSTGVAAADNKVTLTVDRTASNHAYYAVSGTVYSYGMILSGGGDSDLFEIAENVPVQAGLYGSLTDTNGDFTIAPQLLVGGTTLRYLVTYNGSSRIQEVKLPTTRAKKTSLSGFDPYSGEWKTYDAINVLGQYPEIPSWSANGARFTGVRVYQDSLVSDVISALEMTGKKVEISVYVTDGQPYAYGSETLFEHIKDVTFFFRNPITKMIHGQWNLDSKEVTYDKDTDAYKLTIEKFTPDAPDQYTAGDVLYVQLTTDKKFSFDPDLGDVDMVYDPISTGVSVFTMEDYEPETFEFNITNFQSFMQTGAGGDTHASFGQFPWMGQITAAIRSFNFLRKMSGDTTAAEIMEDVDELGGGDFEPYTPEDDGLIAGAEGNLGKGAGDPRLKGIGFSMFFDISYNTYGAVRFKLAAVATKGLMGHYQRMVDPYRSWKNARELSSFASSAEAAAEGNVVGNIERVVWSYDKEVMRQNQSEWVGGYLTFAVYVGLYLDYGYMCIDTYVPGSDKPQTTTDMVFMGAGGFIGARINAGYNGLVPGAPAIYYNLEAQGSVEVYFGRGADPEKTRQAFESAEHHSGQDFGFTFEFKGRVQATGAFGIGYYKIFGARAGVTLGMDFGYSNQMAEWLPQIGTGWGLTTDVTFFGELNLMFITIPVFSYSWPLPLSAGWGEYMQEIQRGQKCIQVVEKQINKGKGSSEARTHTLNLIKQYWDFVDNRLGDADDIRDLWQDIRDYAYDNGIIDKDMVTFINWLRAGGLAGVWQGLAYLEADTNQNRFYIRDHVDSRWVADEVGDLMGAFSPVESRTIMENAYAGTNPKIQSIGDNRYLMFFLDDDNSRDRLQAGKLMWTIYDANTNDFTKPETVQDDMTIDTAPYLADAGDKVIVAWTSIDPEKYEGLIEEVRGELTEKIGPDFVDEIVQMELEEDPSRLSNLLDIYCAEFDKDSGTFGPIVQLTDDEWEDTDPKVVWDEETKDYIVLYTKTAQDSKEYESLDEKLIDNVNPYADPDSTYSVMCYMLYNGTQEDGDEAPVGWVRDHLYDHESKAFGGNEAAIKKFLEQYGGQRFLATSFHGLTDPPIYDLTVANGYNGLAAYAFTADRDFNAETTEDRELYVQFYNFKQHKTYVPVKVAGEITSSDINIPDRQKSGFEIYDYTEAVEVAQPKLIRSGGSTWLFWRENNDGLRYLNISELLNAKVSDDNFEDYDGYSELNFRYALRDDGTLDPAYTLDVQKVDFGSATTSGDLNVTDYQIITDADDNLYVVWTDTVLDKVYNEAIDEDVSKTSVEIFATARIKEEALAETNGGGTVQPVRWSKPYRLTRDNLYHDGVSIALADDGGLIIVHNQYDMLLADTQEELEQMVIDGRAGWKEVDGVTYFVGSPYYPSESDLMITRCAPVGSLEATIFGYSDDSPLPGDEITVKAIVENVGLTAAYGCDVEFYVVKDGMKDGGPIHSFLSDEIVQVNTARETNFKWTVPAEGADGYGFMAVISERKADGSFYEEPVESFSEPFETAPQYEITVNRFEQNGDAFDVEYTVTNTGNAPAPAGMRADLYLKALYGDLEEDYGMDDDLLIEEDISGLAAGESHTVKKTVTLPASVFRLCGYDAVQAIVEDERDRPYRTTDQFFINMKTPMNLSLNDGNPATLAAGDTVELEADYDSNAFIRDTESVLYTVDDPSVAMVDKDGNVTGISSGTTTLTATMLSSGQTVSIPVTVEGTIGEIEVEVDKPVVQNGSSQAEVSVTISEDLADEDALEAVELTLDFDEDVLELDEDSLPDGVRYDSRTKTLTVPVSAFAAFNAALLKFKVKSRTAASDAVVKVKTATPIGTDGQPIKTVDVSVTNPRTPSSASFPYIPQVIPGKKDTTPTKTENPAAETTEPEPAPITSDTPAYIDFNDLTSGAWYEEGVRWTLDNGIMNGTGPNTFAPNTETTRAMIVTMLWRLEGEPLPWSASAFDDVVPGTWYADAVAWAAENGIVTGYDADTFGPNDLVTREQIVTILYRYAKHRGIDTSAYDSLEAFTDAHTVSGWALDAFRWAVGAGVIKGISDTLLSPKTEATRAQVATMLMRFARLKRTSTANSFERAAETVAEDVRMRAMAY
ncbi:MAG: S-layer homology domain-containing protein [Clostridia bacterium]|nr:S-layer homology domain-containing protein [Clostridia bacterium]